jgi:uncharacterized membrane protein YkvA (DUF1232 family)
MAFARTDFWRSNGDDDGALRRSFWRKLRRVVAQIPFAEDLLAAYYCAFDRDTPLPVKATLVGALAYFILPVDAIPDVLPVIGFTDDAVVLATAIRLVAPATSTRRIARRRVTRWQSFKAARSPCPSPGARRSP